MLQSTLVSNLRCVANSDYAHLYDESIQVKEVFTELFHGSGQEDEAQEENDVDGDEHLFADADDWDET